MKIHEGRRPRRFKYQLCEALPLKELESVIETLIKYEKDFCVKESKLGYIVYTTGNDLMTKDEEEKYRNQLWVHNKMKEGRC